MQPDSGTQDSDFYPFLLSKSLEKEEAKASLAGDPGQQDAGYFGQFAEAAVCGPEPLCLLAPFSRHHGT